MGQAGGVDPDREVEMGRIVRQRESQSNSAESPIRYPPPRYAC